MLEYKVGDILKENVEALVNTVNCVGVMGRGIALQFKNAFPGNFQAYVSQCKRNELQPGKMFVYEVGQSINPRYVINFPTKRHWRERSRLEDIEIGLKALIDVICEYHIQSIAIPPLGSGLGGLKWAQVKPLIERAFQPLKNVRVIIYEPQSTSETAICRVVPEMTRGRAALVQLSHRYLGGLLDPVLTLLEIHKLMYFMQIAGEPLKLKYSKGYYGPYAKNLRHVLNAIEGHLISGYVNGGDVPNKQIKLVPGAIKDTAIFLQHHTETLVRFDRVAELVDGFESPFGLELLSTVHWVVQNEPVHSVRDIIKQVYAWNNQKKQFTENQIMLAVEVLTSKGWITEFEGA